MKTVAYYLGQYHPLSVNDKYWGEGFTEWHNVASAQPLFPGHRQPLLPGKLGFYDLRCDSSIINQLNLAKSIGIDAFCYWHYWFAGKRVLHMPLDRIVALPDQGVKVMLGWANESWTGIWHGLSNEVILEQTYNSEEVKEHAKLISSYIKSGRYLKIGDISPFLIYKPRLIPDVKNYLYILREHVRNYGGGDMYIIGTWGPGITEQISSPSDLGLDAVVANNVGRYFSSKNIHKVYTAAWNVVKKIGMGPEIRRYESTIDTLKAARKHVSGTVHSSIVTGWDNTPRSGRRGLVLRQYNEITFRNSVKTAISFEKQNDIKLLFIKSWNEWAEGNTIEPIYRENWSAADVLSKELSNILC